MKKNLLNIAIEKGEKVAKIYNPETLLPFPYEKITSDKNDLSIVISDTLNEVSGNLAGAILYKRVDDGKEEYKIFINSKKSKSKIYFTIAHELGHYFLHKEHLRENKAIFDEDEYASLFSHDFRQDTNTEKQANHFAAALLMPEDKVRDAWSRIDDVDDCAKFFHVPRSVMFLRLLTLKLID